MNETAIVKIASKVATNWATMRGKDSPSQLDIAIIIEIIKMIFALFEDCDTQGRMSLDAAYAKCSDVNWWEKLWLQIRVFRATLGEVKRSERREIVDAIAQAAPTLTVEEFTAAVQECRDCCERPA